MTYAPLHCLRSFSLYPPSSSSLPAGCGRSLLFAPDFPIFHFIPSCTFAYISQTFVSSTVPSFFRIIDHFPGIKSSLVSLSRYCGPMAHLALPRELFMVWTLSCGSVEWAQPKPKRYCAPFKCPMSPGRSRNGDQFAVIDMKLGFYP